MLDYPYSRPLLPRSDEEQILAIMRSFDDHWSGWSDSEPTPSIADYLPDADTPMRSVLFTELLLIDHIHRVDRDVTVAARPVQSPNPAAAADGLAEPSTVTLPSAGRSPQAPPRIPGFSPLTQIGRGGMGLVYKACDLALGRVVALKTLKSGQFADETEVRRFQAEATAAAQLKHPRIVAIHNVAHHDGQYYFTMDYVEGQSLQRRISEGPLPPRQAAELAREIAAAVGYAHDQNIIHRDLKPANVILDEENKPHLTDFGLAKRMESDDELTKVGQVLGTPGYMSPEQARGADKVGRLADVYGLGATLYAMLTGGPPHRGDAPAQTIQLVIGVEPMRPRLVNRAVPRDLETICLKCLSKDPQKRYASAIELASDLDRFLQSRPIVARPAGRVERLARWANRNRLVTALSVFLGLAVASGLVFSLLFAFSAKRALRGKESALSETLRVIDRYVATIYESPFLREERFKPLMEKLLTDALEHYRNLIKSQSGDVEKVAQATEAIHHIGVIFYQFGISNKARSALSEAVRLYSDLTAKFPDNADYHERLATCYNHLGLLAESLSVPAEAIAAYREARHISLRLVADFPKNQTFADLLADVDNNIGNHHRRQGELKKAEDYFLRSISRREKTTPNENRTDHIQKLSGARINLGTVYHSQGRHGPAKREFDTAIGAIQQLIKENDVKDKHAAAEGYSILAHGLNNLGNHYLAQGDSDKALKEYGTALFYREELRTHNPHVIKHEIDVGNSLNNIGSVYWHQEHFEKAFVEYRRAEDLLSKQAGLYVDNMKIKHLLAVTRINVGDAHRVLCRYEEALAKCRLAVRELKELATSAGYPPADVLRHWGYGLGVIGDIKTIVGEHDMAVDSYRDCVNKLLDFRDRVPMDLEGRKHLAKFYPKYCMSLINTGQIRLAIDHAKGMAVDFDAMPATLFGALKCCGRCVDGAKDKEQARSAIAVAVDLLDRLSQAGGLTPARRKQIQSEPAFAKLLKDKDFRVLLGLGTSD